MAFLRTVGCSVGQKICTACDTQFDRMDKGRGGGLYETAEIVEWVKPYRHACITGGEPLDRDLTELLLALHADGIESHVETSGTVKPVWLDQDQSLRTRGWHNIGSTYVRLWVTVSPKPGYRDDMLALAEEIKVILGGLGDGEGWPTVAEAVRWANEGKLVYVQPRNLVNNIDPDAMASAIAITDVYPQLRLSTQLHKYIRTR